MANPPFNVDGVELDQVKDQPRFNTYGVPQNKTKNKKKDAKETVPNGNYLWINQFVPFDKDYVKTFFAGLREDITDHIFEKSVLASKLLDFDDRVIDCDAEIPMQNIEKALRIYQVVLSNYSQYSEQFFEVAAKILNRNYKAPPTLPFDVDDDEELPF